MSSALSPAMLVDASMPGAVSATHVQAALRLRVLRACQGLVPVARQALRFIVDDDEGGTQAVRLECLCAVAPRALRDAHGKELLNAARQALRWVQEEGASLPPAQVHQLSSNNLHAPKLMQEHGACPLPRGSEFAPK